MQWDRYEISEWTTLCSFLLQLVCLWFLSVLMWRDVLMHWLLGVRMSASRTSMTNVCLFGEITFSSKLCTHRMYFLKYSWHNSLNRDSLPPSPPVAFAAQRCNNHQVIIHKETKSQSVKRSLPPGSIQASHSSS